MRQLKSLTTKIGTLGLLGVFLSVIIFYIFFALPYATFVVIKLKELLLLKGVKEVWILRALVK